MSKRLELNVFEKFKLCNEHLHWYDEPNIYKKRVIVSAANKYTNKQTNQDLIIPCVRHSSPELRDLVETFIFNGVLDSHHADEQGFIDQYSNWWTREEAYIIAHNANQIDYERNGSDCALFSEGLY